MTVITYLTDTQMRVFGIILAILFAMIFYLLLRINKCIKEVERLIQISFHEPFKFVPGKDDNTTEQFDPDDDIDGKLSDMDYEEEKNSKSL